jgi:hypothetical protein
MRRKEERQLSPKAKTHHLPDFVRPRAIIAICFML